MINKQTLLILEVVCLHKKNAGGQPLPSHVLVLVEAHITIFLRTTPLAILTENHQLKRSIEIYP